MTVINNDVKEQQFLFHSFAQPVYGIYGKTNGGGKRRKPVVGCKGWQDLKVKSQKSKVNSKSGTFIYRESI